MSNAKEDYRKIAEQFGCFASIGKYGFKLLPKDPGGKIYKLIQVVPLDGWITDPHEIKQALVDDGWSIKARNSHE